MPTNPGSDTCASSPGRTDFDAIVIGAGLAGLTAAAFLARGGASVLVCEQSDRVGGLFDSFWRSGYLFDGGIKAVENSAILLPTLSLLGLLDQVELQPSPVAIITDGQMQPIRGLADIEAYFGLLESLFPPERAGLRHVLDDVGAVYRLLDAALTFPIPFMQPAGSGKAAQKEWLRRHGSALTRLPRAAGLMRGELRPYLSRKLTDQSLINLLAEVFPEGTSVFFGLGYWRMFLDYYYPRDGIQAIPQALAEAVTAAGGEMRLRARVEQVLLEGGRARGVRLATGEEYRAAQVVAACDLRQALTQLVPDTLLPTEFAAKLAHAEVSHSVFNVFLGLDLPPEDLATQGCDHLFYLPDREGITDTDRINREDYFARVPQEISIPCLHRPHLAPPGKTGLVVSAMTSWRYGGGWEGTPAHYAALKERSAYQMVASLERLIPGLTDRIEFSFAATPRTVATRTANSEGAIMGWSYRRGRGLARGSLLKMRDTVLTPVPGLLTAGHWSFSPGGLPIAALTGRLAAEHILKGKGG